MRRQLALLFVLTMVSQASAHDLDAAYKIRDGRVELEVYFDDNTPARNANVIVRDSSGNIIAQGKTDHEGRWSFPVPGRENYEIVVDTGDGHRKVIESTRGSDHPSRAEFTRTPWVKMILGFLLIALAAFGVQAALRRSRSAK
jgi:nickel transport protein